MSVDIGNTEDRMEMFDGSGVRQIVDVFDDEESGLCDIELFTLKPNGFEVGVSID